MIPRHPHKRLRAPAASTALATIVSGLFIALPASSARAATSAAETLTLTSSTLEVQVSRGFPQVVSYRHAEGGTLGGRTKPLSSIVVNGKPRPVTTTATQVDADTVSYDLDFPDLAGVSMTASINLDESVVTFSVDEITDTKDFRVGTIDIPDHDLVSVSSKQTGATVATAIVSPDRTKNGDTITPVTASTPASSAPVGSAYAIVTAGPLAAAIETNSVYDQSRGTGASEAGRIWRQARKSEDQTTVGLWSGQWTYRADGAPFTEELPWAKVVITPEANGDGSMDWQDGAIALRTIANQPQGWEETADRVVTHIPFNFGSQATHPFLRTLDDVKRVSLSTDGLGQLAVLKGYGSEGHDSGHPDYGGNYNTRAGGLADLNTLLAAGDKWAADFGIHVNATESYPEANAFDEKLVDPSKRGWDWLDQSYLNNMRHDLATRNIVDRFAQLRSETNTNLDFLYIDVYYEYGWLQERLARELNDQGWSLGTEWSYHFEEDSLWSHWANDESYGGATNKGLNSQIIRFVRNHQKDVWNPQAILGNTEIVEFEGWTGETDFKAFTDNIWRRNLPAKFLQHHEILDWNADKITFTDGVVGKNTGPTTATRTIEKDGNVVLDGDAYLLPWQTSRGPEKLYHYNTDGGSTTWNLTPDWAKNPSLALYQLTDHGRTFIGNVPVHNGSVTLDAKASTAYVLESLSASTNTAGPKPRWGEGTHITDPGFGASDLRAWNPTGGTVIETNAKGHQAALLRGGPAASISQRLTSLRSGRNALGVWIEIAPGKTRRTTVSVDAGGRTHTAYLDRSTAKNYVAEDEKHSTYYQRVEVPFDVPTGTDSATVTVKAEAGEGDVRVDDVRLVAKNRTLPGELSDGVVVNEDFEEIVQGWSPFVKGDAGGVTGARTHLAERNAPYTQAGWNGKLVDDVIDGEWSLKSHGENAGLVYRTVPQTVRFEPGHRYRVSFDHQVAEGGHYRWVTGYDGVRGGTPRSVEVESLALAEQRTTGRFTSEFVTGDCGDYWVGARKTRGGGNEADLIVDNFVVEDLGATDDQAACATLAAEPVSSRLMRGGPNKVNVSFVNHEEVTAEDVTTSLEVPNGWKAEPETSPTVASVAPGKTAVVRWIVTPPASADDQEYPLTARATYVAGEKRASLRATSTVTLLPPGYLPQSQFKVVDFSSEETANENTPAAHAIDGDPATFWGSRWSGVPDDYPHHITLDIGGTYPLAELRYLPRQNNVNDRIKDYEVYVSLDGVDYTKAASGSWPNSTVEQVVSLGGREAKFVKLVGLNAVNGRPFGGAAELNVVTTDGTPAATP